MSIVDKSSAGVGARQFHIGVAPGEVSTVALLPGDPFRVPLVAEYLEDAREVAHKREHRTMLGTYKGRAVTVTSTGMGCPSTAIAVEELARVGVTSFIRVGSTGALQPGIEPGDLIVSEGAFRNDGTSDMYTPKGYPAVPDTRADARARACGAGPRPQARARRPRRPERERRCVLRRVRGLDAADVRPRPAQRRDGGVRAVHRRPSAAAPRRHDLRGLEQPRGRDQRVRRGGPSAAHGRAGEPASRPPSTPSSSWVSSPGGPEPPHPSRGLGPAGDGRRPRPDDGRARACRTAGTPRSGCASRPT